ncbi:histidine phosphatase family protein [Stieleria sp. TO1_6]|uniref:histidine phosphatase family protein n=1 Tax=Stieleria tagensis TaxID=2956795 RepID=UPI00209B32E3|nr:histidine phosphatase family protein [Stieleria tagensis]MCO8122742.1 histidine phosphatase family protein [Stieleria tagensis]
MQLYMIRHAESANNALPSYQRVEDPAITAVGRLQAQHLADWLKTLTADVMITSPFLRTLQTAVPVLNATDYRLDIWHDVFERGGCFRGFDEATLAGAMGMGKSEILRAMGNHAPRCLLDETIDDNGWWGGRDRETEPAAQQRAEQVCQRLLKSFTENQIVVLLIHADLKRLLLTEMMQGDVNVARLGPIRNVGITKVNRVAGSWQLDYFNSVSHLPAKLITGNEH